MSAPVVEAALAKFDGRDPSTDDRLWVVTHEELEAIELEPVELDGVIVGNRDAGTRTLFARFGGIWRVVCRVETGHDKQQEH